MSSSNNSSTAAFRIIFPFISPSYDRVTATAIAFRKKVLMTVALMLKICAPGFDVELSDESDDVFILAPESALRIEKLLNPDYPHRVKGITVTFCRYALSSSSHNSSTAVRIILPSPYDIDTVTATATATAFRKKALMTVAPVLHRYGFDVELSDERDDVFILTKSTMHIEKLLNPDYPYRVKGMDVTFRRYALSSEDDAQECDENDMCYMPQLLT
jgi:uncharacterized membrane protein YecN with MAPEG domain